MSHHKGAALRTRLFHEYEELRLVRQILMQVCKGFRGVSLIANHYKAIVLFGVDSLRGLEITASSDLTVVDAVIQVNGLLEFEVLFLFVNSLDSTHKYRTLLTVLDALSSSRVNG